MDDIDIALMMMDGDPEGARWLLKKYGGKVQAGLRCEFHHVLADAEIDETLNVAALKAFRAAYQYDESKGSLRAWFYKIAHNAALDILKGEKRHEAVPLAFDPPQPAEVDAQEEDQSHPEQQQLSRDLKEAVASLPRLQKAIIEADLASGGTADAQRLAQVLGSTVNSIYERAWAASASGVVGEQEELDLGADLEGEAEVRGAGAGRCAARGASRPRTARRRAAARRRTCARPASPGVHGQHLEGARVGIGDHVASRAGGRGPRARSRRCPTPSSSAASSSDDRDRDAT